MSHPHMYDPGFYLQLGEIFGLCTDVDRIRWNVTHHNLVVYISVNHMPLVRLWPLLVPIIPPTMVLSTTFTLVRIALVRYIYIDGEGRIYTSATCMVAYTEYMLNLWSNVMAIFCLCIEISPKRQKKTVVDKSSLLLKALLAGINCVEVVQGQPITTTW